MPSDIENEVKKEVLQSDDDHKDELESEPESAEEFEESEDQLTDNEPAIMFTLQDLVDGYKIGDDINVKDLKKQIYRLFRPIPYQPTKNGFDVEFDYIELTPSGQNSDFSSSIHCDNRNKNRYSNVLPPENTRVKLKTIEHPSDEVTDYINGNFIRGLVQGSERAYIATQGPLTSTFQDFWRMVWEYNCAVVVMLTKEIENGRLKCDRYWPDEKESPLELELFVIRLVECSINEELTIRKFVLTNTETKEVRNIIQIQYTGWPDHGLPLSTGAFLEIVDLANKENKNNAPLVVHCSAGIGRSGTFCTVHSNMEKVVQDIKSGKKDKSFLNIVKTILAMREQRPGMVQTKEQEMFCYLALLEAAQREGFEMNEVDPLEDTLKLNIPQNNFSDQENEEDIVNNNNNSNSNTNSNSNSNKKEGKSDSAQPSNDKPKSNPDKMETDSPQKADSPKN